MSGPVFMALALAIVWFIVRVGHAVRYPRRRR